MLSPRSRKLLSPADTALRKQESPRPSMRAPVHERSDHRANLRGQLVRRQMDHGRHILISHDCCSPGRISSSSAGSRSVHRLPVPVAAGAEGRAEATTPAEAPAAAALASQLQQMQQMQLMKIRPARWQYARRALPRRHQHPQPRLRPPLPPMSAAALAA